MWIFYKKRADKISECKKFYYFLSLGWPSAIEKLVVSVQLKRVPISLLKLRGDKILSPNSRTHNCSGGGRVALSLRRRAARE